jgi:hypothetical protein
VHISCVNYISPEEEWRGDGGLCLGLAQVLQLSDYTGSDGLMIWLGYSMRNSAVLSHSVPTVLLLLEDASSGITAVGRRGVHEATNLCRITLPSHTSIIKYKEEQISPSSQDP